MQLPKVNNNDLSPVFGGPFYYKSLVTIFLFFISQTLFAQDFNPRVSQLQFAEVDYTQKTIFQDSTGLMWIFGLPKWYISDGEEIFEVPMPIKLKKDSYILGFIQNGDRFYMGGDSVRVFNPYSRKFEGSIGLDPSIDLKGEPPFITYPYKLNDSTLFGAYVPLKSVPIEHAIYTFVLSINGQPYQEFNPSFRTRLREGHSFAFRGDQLFASRMDSVFQYDLKGTIKKIYPFEKLSSIPKSCEPIVSVNEDISFFHYVSSPEPGKYLQTRFILKPNAEDFVQADYPKFGEYRGPFSKNGADYWKHGLGQLSLHRFKENEAPVNYTKLLLAQYPEVSYFGDYVVQLTQDNSNSIWATSYLNGIFKFSNINQPYTHYLSLLDSNPSCPDNRCMIRGLTSDGQGNIYMAYDFGIKKIEINTGLISEVKFDLSNRIKAANSLTYYKDKLYFNAMEIDPITGLCKELIPNLNDHHTTHYIDTSRNMMWLADAAYYDNYSDSIIMYQYDLSTSISKLLPGLRRPGGKDNQVSQFHLSPTTQTMFVATVSEGLYELNLEGEILNHYVDSTGYGMRRILSLYEDEYNQLWIGHTRLSKLDLLTKEFTQTPFYSNQNSFDIAYAYSIQKQSNLYSWIGTNKGIFRLNVKTGEVQDFKMISGISGKEYNRLSHFIDEDGHLFFGSIEGLFKFHPDSLVKASGIEKIFPLRLSRFSTYDNRIDSLVHHFHELSTTFHIRPYVKYFSFDIFSSDLRSPEKNKYSWWLEGYENNWSRLSTTNHIRYEKLPPGEYTLHVKGGLSPSYYDSSQRKFEIVVHQIWYKTTLAVILYALFLFGLMYALYRHQLNKKLTEAESIRLKELDEVKNRLYANITHEFRTPLTVIMGMTDNIEGHETEKLLISRNSKNLLRLINQMLDLSKLDSGTMKLDTVQSDVINYLQYLTESFYSMAEEKKVRLMFYPETKELTMDFDEVKLQHIIYNLLSNALKFSEKGDKVVLHASQLEKSGDRYLQLKVSDTGIGIIEEDVSMIFDRFYQSKNQDKKGRQSINPQSAGSGIGLALTKELIEMMEGSIEVKSQLGKGTEFTILLPIVLEQNTPAMNSMHEPMVTVSDILEGDKPHLLIIEDNADVMTYISGLLKSRYDLILARDGAEGIHKALEMIPDLIISDVMMPIKNGYEVCQTLKQDERTSHIPIILLTAKATTEDRLDGLSEGADAYLVKPFDKKELFIRVEQLLSLRKKLQERFGTFQNVSSAKPSLDKVFLQKLIGVIENRINDPDLNVKGLCAIVQLSNMQVNRKLKALTGKTPSGFIRSVRIQKGMELLKTTSLNISEIAYDVGFNNPNYFSRAFSEEYGVSPSSIRK